MGIGEGMRSRAQSMHDAYARYQKEGSLHEALEKEGFRNVTGVKRTNRKGLLNMLNSYSKGCYKIAIVDGSEIGANPVYLPQPLSSYYVIYVKDTRKQGSEVLEAEFDPRILSKGKARENAITGLHSVVQDYAMIRKYGEKRPISRVVPTDKDALELYDHMVAGNIPNLRIHGLGDVKRKLLKEYLVRKGLVTEQKS